MLKEDIDLYNQIRDARAKLEKQAQYLKEKEQVIKAKLLATLTANGLDSITESGFTVFKKHNIRAEITNHEALQEVMYNLMTEARAEGRPLQDGLLLQRTVSKSSVVDLIHERLGLKEDEELDVADDTTIAEAAKLGIRLVDNLDISIRKK